MDDKDLTFVLDMAIDLSALEGCTDDERPWLMVVVVNRRVADPRHCFLAWLSSIEEEAILACTIFIQASCL